MSLADGLKWAFLVLPNYCLGQGISDMFNNYNALELFQEAVEMCMNNPKLPFPRTECEEIVRQYGGSTFDFEFQDNYLSWANPGIGRYLIFLAWEGAVFFALVLLVEFRVFRRLVDPFRFSVSKKLDEWQPTTLADDGDVLAERARIMTSSTEDDVLVIKNLTKLFNGKRGDFS